MFGLFVHMAAKDGDGMRTAVEALRWHVTFQPSVVHVNAARSAQNEIGRRSVWAMQYALHMLHLALERCLVTRGEEV